MSTHICPNCSNEFTEQFCNRCGQKVVHRITMSHLWHDLVHAFTHADKGFLYLMGQLFIRPGIVAREYIIEGKRKRYFTPLQYVIILSAITTIIVVNSHFMEHTMKSMNELTGNNSQYSQKQAEFSQKLSLLMGKYYNILALIQLPFFALAGFVFYRRKKYNYAEILTLQTFISGQHMIMSMVVMMFLFFTNSSLSLNIILLLISMSYQVWAYMQFFQQKSIGAFFKAVACYIFAMIMFIIVGMLIGTIGGLIIYITSH